MPKPEHEQELEAKIRDLSRRSKHGTDVFVGDHERALAELAALESLARPAPVRSLFAPAGN